MCVAGSLAFCTAAAAVTEDAPAAGNPYLAIVERNVFGLKPPPPPPDPEANKPPPPKILLQGITTFGGVKRVLFKMAEPPKAGQPGKGEQSYVLAEGQRDGEVEVLEINPVAGTVKVNNYGTVTELDFEKNGIKAPAAPAAAAAGAPPGSVPAPPKPGAPFPNPMGAPATVPSPFPSRTVRTSGMTGTFPPQAAGTATGAPVVGVGGTALNLAGGGQSYNPGVTQPPVATRQSQEANLLMLEANRLRHQQAVQSGRRAPLPRHPLTEGLANETPAPQ